MNKNLPVSGLVALTKVCSAFFKRMVLSFSVFVPTDKRKRVDYKPSWKDQLASSICGACLWMR